MLTELHDIRDADKLADTIVDQIIAVLQCAPALPARSNYLDWALVLADARRTAAECIYARIRDHVDRHDVINTLIVYDDARFGEIFGGYARAQINHAQFLHEQDVAPDDASGIEAKEAPSHDR
jgi:hypothetical protein